MTASEFQQRVFIVCTIACPFLILVIATAREVFK